MIVHGLLNNPLDVISSLSGPGIRGILQGVPPEPYKEADVKHKCTISFNQYLVKGCTCTHIYTLWSVYLYAYNLVV